MVSPISIPRFPSMHTHLSSATCASVLESRLAAVDASLAAFIASLPSLPATEYAKVFDNVFDASFEKFRRGLLSRGAEEGISAPLATDHYVSPAIEPIQLPRCPICADRAQSLLIPSAIQAPPLLSSSPLLRALTTSVVKPHLKDSAAATVLLPESKTGIHASTMTSAPRLLQERLFSDTTKNGPEVVLNLSIISATSEAIFPSLLTDNYNASRNDKYGWINWYLVGKFAKKNLFALPLFDELPKRGRENNMAIMELIEEMFSNEYFPFDPSNNHSIPQTILLLRKLCRTNRGEQGRAATNTYCQLLLSQSDNDVKLTVLDRLTELKSSHREVVTDMFMDMLRALSSHNLDIMRKTIDVVLSELPFLSVSEEVSNDSSHKFQQVNSMAVSFKRPTILADGTYVTHPTILADGTYVTHPTILADGTYVTHHAASGIAFWNCLLSSYPFSRIRGIWELEIPASHWRLFPWDKVFSQALLIVVSMLQLGQSPVLQHPIDSDSYAGMVLSIKLLGNIGDEVRKIWLKSCCQSFVDMLSKKQLRETEEIKATTQISQAQLVRLLLHRAISGALYAEHIHSLLQRECITESFRQGLSWLLRFIDKWIHSMDLENHNPRIEHYGCMVDLLSHVNLLNVTVKFIRDMPTQPNVVIWGSLLFTCRIYGNIELVELVNKRIEVFEPQGAYVNSPRTARSPLIWDGHQDAVEVLLQNNANLVAENNDSITPLQSSVRPVYCALIKLLQDNDLSVRLAACRSICLHSEDASFSEREFINLLPIYWDSYLKLIKEVQELDSKKAWEESANECLLQIQLLVGLSTTANWEDFHNSIFKP